MTNQTLPCRDLLSAYLTTKGFYTEAENVLNGIDLESYENELSIVEFMLTTGCPMKNTRAQSSAPEGGEAVAGLWIGEPSSEGTQGYGFSSRPALHELPPGNYALYTRSNAQGGEMHVGWLVENGKQGSELRYRCMRQGLPEWTADHNEAIRFCRRIDAERFAEEDDEAWRIVEHAWHDVSALSTSRSNDKGMEGG